jgi:glycerate 2-kinase
VIIRNQEELLSHGNRRGRETALEILEAGLQAVDPYDTTLRLIRREGDRLLVGGQPDMDVSGYGDETIDLSQVENIYVVGAGKAIQRQARALEELLGDRLTGGAVTIKRGEEVVLSRIEVTEGAHPVPDEASVEGSRRIMEIARSAGERDLVFALFGSGCSSLFVLPSPGVSLADVQEVYRLAIKYGFQTLIHRVMIYFSEVTAGRITEAIHPARAVHLVSALARFDRWHGVLPTGGAWICSWPPGPRRMERSLAELRAEPWWGEVPESMRERLEQLDPAYEVPDLERFRRMSFSFWQPVDSRQMLVGASRRAEELGLSGAILGSWDWIPCAATAQLLAGVAKEVALYGSPVSAPAALISGGELAVPFGGGDGVGGRNQEFALSSILWIPPALRERIVVASVDSDGTDGPGTQLRGPSGEALPTLAGGIADGHTPAEAAALGIDLAAELRRHNSTPPLMKLRSGILTGNTGICAGDLRVTLIM